MNNDYGMMARAFGNRQPQGGMGQMPQQRPMPMQQPPR